LADIVISAQMSEREEKEQQLRDAIKNCIILSDEDREFWLGHISMLPDVVLENVTKIIVGKNNIIDSYIAQALTNDPDHKYLSQLKAEIKKFKEQAFSLDEAGEKESAEEILKKQLEGL